MTDEQLADAFAEHRAHGRRLPRVLLDEMQRRCT
jgi:hypothetical protein